MKEAPIIFKPYLKSVIWGGEKICDYKGIDQEQSNIGESWEISAVNGHESLVVDGYYKGKSLTELIDNFGEELLGKNVIKRYGNKFPLLIKFIDARDNLSIQVHPNDELAKKRHGSLGKTEMWYIISTDKGAKIYAGLKEKMTPEEYVRKISDNTFSESLAIHDSHPGDIFFLPAGRVHAIGSGNLLAEIQESSDITYRIYDYGRKDSEGKERELHTELAKDAIDFKVYPDYRTQIPQDEREETPLVDCDHFVTSRIILDGKKNMEMDGSSFVIFICIKGNVKITCAEGEIDLTQGTTGLVPAKARRFLLGGKGTLLSTVIP